MDVKLAEFETILSKAAKEEQERVLQQQLQHEVDGHNINGLLAATARNGHPAMAQLLLGRGAEIEAKNAMRETALHIAAFHGQKRYCNYC
jgi:ankyrin repeat protein